MITTLQQLILNHSTTDKSGKKLFTEEQVRMAFELGQYYPKAVTPSNHSTSHPQAR